MRRPSSRAPRPRTSERRVRRQQHEQPAAVRPEAAARDRDERDARERDAQPAEQRRPHDRGDEQHRLEQVGDAVEAARLGRAERRECNGAGVEAEDEEVGEEHRGAGEAEREEDRGERDEGDEPPSREPEVRGEAEQDDARCEPRLEDGGDVRERADEERQREPDAVVPLDPVLEPLERRHRILDRDDLEPAVRHVGERDEPVDPRRARGQDAARPRGERDRVAVFSLLPAGGRTTSVSGGGPVSSAISGCPAGVPPSSELRPSR